MPSTDCIKGWGISPNLTNLFKLIHRFSTPQTKHPHHHAHLPQMCPHRCLYQRVSSINRHLILELGQHDSFIDRMCQRSLFSRRRFQFVR